jgi:hypothetical protein
MVHFASAWTSNHLLGSAHSNETWSEVCKRCGGDDCLRERDEPLYEVVAPLWVEFGKGVVEEEEGRLATIGGEQLDLGKQEREEEAALLASRCNGREILFVNVKREVVTMWADKCMSLVALALRRLVERGAQASGGGVNPFVDQMSLTRNVVHA